MTDPRPGGTMSHEEAAAELGAAALGALGPADHDAVIAHAAGCEQCAAELASLRAVAARLAEQPPGDAPDAARSAERRLRLVSRAREEQRARQDQQVRSLRVERVAAEPTHVSGRVHGPHAHEPLALVDHVIVPAGIGHRRRAARPWLAPLAALAASAAFVVAAVGYWGAREELQQVRTALGLAAQTHAAELSLLRTAMRERDEQMARLTGPSVQVVELSASRGAAPQMRVFWDQASNSWTLVGHGVPVLPDGRTYQVWLVTGSEKRSAGTFVPTPSGEAFYRTTHSLDGAALTAVAITVEPKGGVAVATGPVVMLGAVSRGN